MRSSSLGAYELEGELGHGGMARVYRARHVTTGAVRAIKVLEGSPGSEDMVRFRLEADALARLHPGDAVAIHETGSEGGKIYFVMDLMPGGSLRDRLRSRGKIAWGEASRLVARLARAVGRAHDMGLAHRDLKPENILFDEQGEARLADWGCVRDLGAATLTETGNSLGTPLYMAPEQLDGRRAGRLADIYALGVILQEILTGSPPYPGKTWLTILTAIRTGRRERVAALAGTPPGLEAVLDRALAFDPLARYPHAAELASDLEKLASGKPPTPPTRVRRAPRLALVAVLVFALAGYGLWRFLGREGEDVHSPHGGGGPRLTMAAVEAAIADPAPITSEQMVLVTRAFADREVVISFLVFQHPAKLVEPLRAARRETPALGRLFAVAAIGAGRVELRAEALAAWKESGNRGEPGRSLVRCAVSVDALAETLLALPLEASSPAGEGHARAVRAALTSLLEGERMLATKGALAVILDPLRPIAREALRDQVFQAATAREVRLADLNLALEKVPPDRLPALLEACAVSVRTSERKTGEIVALIPIVEQAALRLEDEPQIAATCRCWLGAARDALWEKLPQHDPGELDRALEVIDLEGRGTRSQSDSTWSFLMERSRHHMKAWIWLHRAEAAPSEQESHWRRAQEEARKALAATEEVKGALNSIPHLAPDDARFVVQIIFRSERFEDLDDDLRDKISREDPLFAEILRRKDRDPEAALRALPDIIATAVRTGANERNAHAVCALAAADVGDFARAESELAKVREYTGEPEIDTLAPKAVEAYVREKQREKRK